MSDQVAIKIIDMRKIKEDYLKQNVNREALILGQLRHPNIIRLYETMKATTLYCLVTEYAVGRDILTFLKSHKEHRLSEEKARPFTRQIISAVHYLHERGVCHRDLKMENIMLDENKKSIKIVDFGLSNTFTMDELMKTHCGSPEYAAPELFSAGEKYGPEVDIWAIGIIIYAMLVGKLPFTTVYTDQYRRIKLLKQIEKGIQQEQEQEMLHLTQECRDLIRSIIEPKPDIRLPMLDIEIHPWITEGSKVPFFPFVAMPRDKSLKSQVIDELSSALSMKKEQIETTVHENKSDEISAMFNMLLHKKRIESGVYDIDHTLKSFQCVEGKGKKKRSKSDHTDKDGGKKSKNKVPPELVLPKEVSDDKTQHSAGSKEPGSAGHETKFSSFDFLALCSTPTWLGPERRRSRRRSRSPGPTSPAPHADAPRYCLAPLPLTDSQGKIDSPHGKGNLLSPDAAYSAKNSVPQTQNSPSLRRASSLRYSKRRNRSGSIGSKRKTFGRSSSVDVPCAKVESVDKVFPIPTPKSPVQRPANLVLQECYPNKLKEGKGTSGTNGPLTSVEVHFTDSLNLCSSTDLPKAPSLQTRLDLPTLETSQVMQKHPPNLTKNNPEIKDNLCVVRPKDIAEHSRKKLPPKKPPRNFLTVSDAYRNDDDIDDDAAMQVSGYSLSQDTDGDFCRSSPERTDLVRDIEQELSDLRLLEMEECEDRVDSMVELLSDKRSQHSGKENYNAHVKIADLSFNIHPKGCTNMDKKQTVAACSESNPDEIETLHSKSSNFPNQVDSSNSSQVRLPASKLKTPTTPTWKLLKTPLARIESFHSDEFDFFSSDTVDKGDNLSISPNTPTVPCFSYKLNLGKKKPPKLKCKESDNSKNKCLANHTALKSQDMNVCRLEPVVTDPLLSSGSETEPQEDSKDKISSTGKVKIHPMDLEEQDSDSNGSKFQKTVAIGYKSENRISSHSNAITKQPNQIQNSVNRIKNVTNQDPKKKGDHIKSSPWKRSFTQFLKKKRPTRTPSNNNNNDSSTNQIAGRNGHTPNSPVNKSETNVVEGRSKDSESRWILAPNNSIGNNIISEVELQSSSLAPRSPSPTPRVFDFSVINDSPKGKSCLLSWRTCRDCGISEASSEEESEIGIQLEQNVNLNLNSTLEANNIQESSCLSVYQYAPT